MTTEELKQLHNLRGLKARHIPYERTDNGWQQNLEHEEEVILLEYFNTIEVIPTECWGNIQIKTEGILFIRPDFKLGRDRLDSFTIIK